MVERGKIKIKITAADIIGLEQSNNNIQDNWKAPQQEILSLLIVYSIYGAREQISTLQNVWLKAVRVSFYFTMFFF